MKTYLKLAAILAVLGVALTSVSAQAAGSHGAAADKGKANAHGMNPNANTRAPVAGMATPAMPDAANPAIGSVNAHGMNPNANPRAALGGMSGQDRAAEARARNKARMAERDAERAAEKAAKEAAEAA